MAKLAINVSGAGNSDQYGTFINFNNLLSGNVIRGLEITQNSSPDMTVRVKAGNGIVREGSWPGEIGWHVAIDTADPGDSVTIATSDPSNARIDYVLAWIDKTAAASPTGTNNTNVFKVTAVAGTPSGSPVVPTSGQIQTAIGASNPYFILAQIAVGASVTQITTANINNDVRTLATVGTNNLTDAAITNTKLSTTAGEVGGAWQTWTPAWTNLTVGNGTLEAKYTRVGKTIRFKLSLVFGSTTSISGGIGIAPPAPPATLPATTRYIVGILRIEDSGMTNMSGFVQMESSVLMYPFVGGASSAYTNLSLITATLPFTWGTGDWFTITGEYEAA